MSCSPQPGFFNCEILPLLSPYPLCILLYLFFYWSRVDLPCCASFRCTAKWFSYIYTFQILFHYTLLQDIEYSSLCNTVGPCCLSILYIVVCVFLCVFYSSIVYELRRTVLQSEWDNWVVAHLHSSTILRVCALGTSHASNNWCHYLEDKPELCYTEFG